MKRKTLVSNGGNSNSKTVQQGGSDGQAQVQEEMDSELRVIFQQCYMPDITDTGTDTGSSSVRVAARSSGSSDTISALEFLEALVQVALLKWRSVKIPESDKVVLAIESVARLYSEISA